MVTKLILLDDNNKQETLVCYLKSAEKRQEKYQVKIQSFTESLNVARSKRKKYESLIERYQRLLDDEEQKEKKYGELKSKCLKLLTQNASTQLEILKSI